MHPSMRYCITSHLRGNEKIFEFCWKLNTFSSFERIFKSVKIESLRQNFGIILYETHWDWYIVAVRGDEIAYCIFWHYSKRNIAMHVHIKEEPTLLINTEIFNILRWIYKTQRLVRLLCSLYFDLIDMQSQYTPKTESASGRLFIEPPTIDPDGVYGPTVNIIGLAW